MDLAVGNPLSEELEGDVAFGGEIGGGFRARIADVPIAYPLSVIANQFGVHSPTLPILNRFEPILVPHRFSILKDAGLAAITAVGIRIEYQGEQTCSIVSLLPEHEFVQVGEVAFQCSVGAAGDVAVDPTVLQGLVPIGLGGSLKAGASVRGTLCLRGAIATPRISAVGKGSRSCEWQFALDGDPLYGRDIETWTVAMFPKRIRTIPCKIQISVTRRTAFIPTRWESDAVVLDCCVERGSPTNASL